MSIVAGTNGYNSVQTHQILLLLLRTEVLCLPAGVWSTTLVLEPFHWDQWRRSRRRGPDQPEHNSTLLSLVLKTRRNLLPASSGLQLLRNASPDEPSSFAELFFMCDGKFAAGLPR